MDRISLGIGKFTFMQAEWSNRLSARSHKELIIGKSDDKLVTGSVFAKFLSAYRPYDAEKAS